MGGRVIKPGDKFERLTVLRLIDTQRWKGAAWLCRCDCGEVHTVRAGHLRSGGCKSCGCLSREMARRRGRNSWKHGMLKTKEYKAFDNAKQRCTNPNKDGYNNYGGRGIEFRFNSFVEFFEEIGKAPSKKHSIDRIDNDGHYEAGNIRWVTQTKQIHNRRRL